MQHWCLAIAVFASVARNVYGNGNGHIHHRTKTRSVALFLDVPHKQNVALPHHYIRVGEARLRESQIVTQTAARRAFALAYTEPAALSHTSPSPTQTVHNVHLAQKVGAAAEAWQDILLHKRRGATVVQSAWYRADSAHELSATAMLTPLLWPGGDDVETARLRCWIEIDGGQRRMGEATLRGGRRTYAAHANRIILQKGYHRVDLMVYAERGRWCSCPSAGDGFQSGRHLLAWYTPSATSAQNAVVPIPIIPLASSTHRKNTNTGRMATVLYRRVARYTSGPALAAAPRRHRWNANTTTCAVLTPRGVVGA